MEANLFYYDLKLIRFERRDFCLAKPSVVITSEATLCGLDSH